MSKRIVLEVSNGVAHAQLARPEKMNAIDLAMFEALLDIPRQLRADPSVRCVVLSGQGRAFCAGLDTGAFAALAGDPDAVDRLMSSVPGSPANRAQQAAHGWAQLPVPVIAAIHGVCFGGGLQVALAADIRIVTPDARLSVMEIKWGLIPDMTGIQSMQRLVRGDIARELTYSGRQVSGEEAARLGLATRVAENPVEEALALARSIAERSPDAIRAAKQLFERLAPAAIARSIGPGSRLATNTDGQPQSNRSYYEQHAKALRQFYGPERLITTLAATDRSQTPDLPCLWSP